MVDLENVGAVCKIKFTLQQSNCKRQALGTPGKETTRAAEAAASFTQRTALDAAPLSRIEVSSSLDTSQAIVNDRAATMAMASST